MKCEICDSLREFGYVVSNKFICENCIDQIEKMSI